MKLDLKSLYKQKIVPSLIEEFGYKNIEQVPKLVKISVNRGVGEASKNSKELDSSLEELTLIVGQAPTINKASKSVAGFKIRDGMPIGTSVTLRKEQMYNFLTKLIHIVLPRIRDFRGINPNGFDGRGNYNLGLKEQLKYRGKKDAGKTCTMTVSVAPEPRLVSVCLGFGSSFWSKSSAQLGSLSFSKSSYLKNSANTSFLKNFEKQHWQSTVLMGKFQFFLSTMAPEDHFQPKD